MRFVSYLRSLLGRRPNVETSQSNLVRVGMFRHLQHTRERGPRQGPDDLVRYFLSPYRVRRALWQDMTEVRADPFYHYLLARTRFYDEILRKALHAGVQQVLILGAGQDTRAYRFATELVARDVRVIEADQTPTIHEKRAAAHRLEAYPHVRWVEIDLEDVCWSDWVGDAGLRRSVPTFVMMEGVAPYLTADAYRRAVRFLAEFVGPGSRFGLDVKMGSDPDGHFRVPDQEAAIRELHAELGLRPTLVLRGPGVQARFTEYESPVFREDAVLHAET